MDTYLSARPCRKRCPPYIKLLAIDRIAKGETKASVARGFCVPESTIRGWCKNEQRLRHQIMPYFDCAGTPPPTKRVKKLLYDENLDSVEKSKITADKPTIADKNAENGITNQDESTTDITNNNVCIPPITSPSSDRSVTAISGAEALKWCKIFEETMHIMDLASALEYSLLPINLSNAKDNVKICTHENTTPSVQELVSLQSTEVAPVEIPAVNSEKESD